MSKRVCLDCMATIAAGRSRCGSCERVRDRARGTRQQRGYDAAHDRLRTDYQNRMDEGEAFDCWRCGQAIDPSAWDLGHRDDRQGYAGPECRPCNRATASRR